MRLSLRLFSHSVVGICGAASLGTLFVVGCVSGPRFHSSRFWDKEDLKSTSTDADRESRPSQSRGLWSSKSQDDAAEVGQERARLADAHDPLARSRAVSARVSDASTRRTPKTAVAHVTDDAFAPA